MIESSNSTANKSFVAMLAALANVSPNKVLKTDRFSSKYVSLDELLDSIKPTLASHGFALRQVLLSEDGKVGVHTYFLHESGATFDGGKLMVKGESLNPQQLGSALTYIKRQSIQTACCISTDGDDDGAKASGGNYAKAVVKESLQPAIWTDFIPSALQAKAKAYCVGKGWITADDLLIDLDAGKVDAILGNKEGFLKAIQK